MQHPVHNHRLILHLKVKPILLRPETVKNMPIPLNPPKSVTPQPIKIRLTHPELLQQLQLLKSPQRRKLRRTDFIKNNLEHPPI